MKAKAYFQEVLLAPYSAIYGMPRLACTMWVDNNLNSKCRNGDGEEITPIFVPHLPYNNVLF